MDEHWLARPATHKLLWRGFIAILALTVAADFSVTGEPHFGIETSLAFNAWYGFFACAVLIVFAKGVAAFLKRRDDYYGRRDD